MAIGDIYELTHVMEDAGTKEKITNKWYFAAVDVFASAQGCFEAFTEAGGLMTLVNNCQNVNTENVLVRVINLFSITDFYEAEAVGVGGMPGEQLPLFNAISISLKVDTRGVAAGGKRISGISETYGSRGLISFADLVGNINALVAAIPEDMVDGDGGTYDPVVVKRVRSGLGTPVSPYEYRLPTDVGELNYGHIVAALASSFLSHQISRGNGR